jgi:hypothetical protein
MKTERQAFREDGVRSSSNMTQCAHSRSTSPSEHVPEVRVIFGDPAAGGSNLQQDFSRTSLHFTRKTSPRLV